MKILFLSTSMGLGGADRQILYLCRSLSDRGHEVGVLSLTPLGPMGVEAKQAGMDVMSLDMSRGVPDPGAVWKTVAVLRQKKPQVLTNFMYHADILGRIAGRLAGVPVVISSVRNEKFGGWWRERVFSLTAELTDKITANSRLAADSLVRRGVIANNRLRVIPNGVILENYQSNLVGREALRRQMGIGEDGFLWLAVGRLREQKDYPNLLRACPEFIGEGPNTRVRVVGEGPLLADLKDLARELGVSGMVEFLGGRKDVPALLDAADGFVLSSAWEGMPNVVMEALASGKPVVATRVGGVPELIQDQISGIIVPPGDSGALADGMRRVMGFSREERVKMGQAGRNHIQAEYSQERVAQMWEDLFREMLQLKGLGR